MAIGLNGIPKSQKRERIIVSHLSPVDSEIDSDSKTRPWQNSDNRPLGTRTLKAKMAVEKAKQKESIRSLSDEQMTSQQTQSLSRESETAKIETKQDEHSYAPRLKQELPGLFAFLSFLFRF